MRRLRRTLPTDLKLGRLHLEKHGHTAGDLEKIGFGYGGALALYLNQMTVPNTLPSFFYCRTKESEPLFRNRSWMDLNVDHSTLLEPRSPVRLDNSIRSKLLGNALIRGASSPASISVFDFSHLSDYLDFLELANFGLDTDAVESLMLLDESDLEALKARGYQMGAISFDGSVLRLTTVGRQILDSAHSELERLSKLSNHHDSSNLAARAVLHYS